MLHVPCTSGQNDFYNGFYIQRLLFCPLRCEDFTDWWILQYQGIILYNIFFFYLSYVQPRVIITLSPRGEASRAEPRRITMWIVSNSHCFVTGLPAYLAGREDSYCLLIDIHYFKSFQGNIYRHQITASGLRERESTGLLLPGKYGITHFREKKSLDSSHRAEVHPEKMDVLPFPSKSLRPWLDTVKSSWWYFLFIVTEKMCTSVFDGIEVDLYSWMQGHRQHVTPTSSSTICSPSYAYMGGYTSPSGWDTVECCHL